MIWTKTAALRVDCRCTLGEGIVWWPSHGVLLWTDIDGARLWMYDPATEETRTWTLSDRLACMGLCESGKLLLGLSKGLFVAEPDVTRTSGQLDVAPLVAIETDLGTRLNDGRPDRAGNFVFGTMDLGKKQRIGSFYQYSARHGLRRLALDPVAISNSICFSPDGTTMYFCDSPQRRIMRCEYDSETAVVSRVRAFANVTSGGSPDGSIVDADGCLWNAEWGASLVRRYTSTGATDGEVHVRAKQPSCPVLGGPDLGELFVTTAREALPQADLDAMPEAGGVYSARVDARGLPETPIRGL